MGSNKDMAFTTSIMETATKDNGSKDYVMELVFNTSLIMINMMGSGIKDKNMGKE
jgi:hypothetical protein